MCVGVREGGTEACRHGGSYQECRPARRQGRCQGPRADQYRGRNVCAACVFCLPGSTCACMSDVIKQTRIMSYVVTNEDSKYIAILSPAGRHNIAWWQHITQCVTPCCTLPPAFPVLCSQVHTAVVKHAACGCLQSQLDQESLISHEHVAFA